MTKYTLKNPIVEAFQFNNDSTVALPSWAANYEVRTPVNGLLKLSKDNLLGRLIVPTIEGHTFATVSDWLVFDGKVIRVIRNTLFKELYEALPVDAPVAVPKPVEVVVNDPPVAKTLLATDAEPITSTTAGPATGPVDQGPETTAQATEPEQTSTEA